MTAITSYTPQSFEQLFKIPSQEETTSSQASFNLSLIVLQMFTLHKLMMETVQLMNEHENSLSILRNGNMKALSSNSSFKSFLELTSGCTRSGIKIVDKTTQDCNLEQWKADSTIINALKLLIPTHLKDQLTRSGAQDDVLVKQIAQSVSGVFNASDLFLQVANQGLKEHSNSYDTDYQRRMDQAKSFLDALNSVKNDTSASQQSLLNIIRSLLESAKESQRMLAQN